MSQSGSKIYVGNLSYSVDEEQLSDYFKQFGSVKELTLIKDRETGRSKGFAFVEYDSPGDAEKAIREANGHDLGGRAMNVNLARDKDSSGGSGGRRPPRHNRNGGGGRSGGGRFSGHGGGGHRGRDEM
ncbi:MAG: hypothetical protein A3F41_04755 [Coxiella sp. RIFCSPHIGHO2_12_FULL_44_14]|nr:MAG: hypothetical protein A3F41_04755 [Coxiella sp. RIFCSPHIGHO2_12_FULL_44_14]